MITGLTVVSAVCRKLHAAFPSIPIYREHIGENFDEPSFFVWTENVAVAPFDQRKFLLKQQIEIHYFPRHDNTAMYEDMLGIGIQLTEVLNSINCKIAGICRPIWAISPSYRIVDGNMLSYSVQFNIEAYPEEKKPELMGELNYDVDVKTDLSYKEN